MVSFVLITFRTRVPRMYDHCHLSIVSLFIHYTVPSIHNISVYLVPLLRRYRSSPISTVKYIQQSFPETLKYCKLLCGLPLLPPWYPGGPLYYKGLFLLSFTFPGPHLYTNCVNPLQFPVGFTHLPTIPFFLLQFSTSPPCIWSFPKQSESF